MSNVTHIHPGMDTSAAVADATKILKEVCERCDTGSVTGIAIVTYGPDGNVRTHSSYMNGQVGCSILGGLKIVSDHIADDLRRSVGTL